MELFNLSDLQKNLIDKNYSAAEVTRFLLERIKKLNPKLNVFLTLDEEKSFKDASHIDSLITEYGKDALKDKPLLGLPVSYKDLFLTEGIRTTASSKVLNDYVPVYSATAVERLTNAGAIFIGKTNCDAWAHGGSGENSDFFPTKNPWNFDVVPGGSSSGSAVSVASDMALVSMGTDTGGSVRLPASFCGVTGFKPTYGAVSRYGVIAMASSLDTVGHFAKEVSDISSVFDVLAGPDGFDSTVIAHDFEEKDFKKFKIGIADEYLETGVGPSVRKVFEDTKKVFSGLGVDIEAVKLPSTKYAISIYYIIQPAEVSSNLARYDGVRYGGDRNSFGDEAKRRIMLGSYALSSGYYDVFYLKAMKARTKLIEDFDRAFESVDAILAPVSPTPPFGMGERVNDPLQMYLTDVLTVSANLAGIPAISFPAGFDEGGLPVGMQLMGNKFSERKLFSLVEKFQNETDWHKRRPDLNL